MKLQWLLGEDRALSRVREEIAMERMHRFKQISKGDENVSDEFLK